MNEQKVSKKTKYTYAMTGMGRDMMYALYGTYLMVFFTDALGFSKGTILTISILVFVARIWDAINDPIMGTIIDNTKSRFGKFKPWILSGALLSSIFFIILFQDWGLSGIALYVTFFIVYVLSGMSFTMNDIAYWSMYPSFTADAKEREQIGSLARIFASLGMFIVIAAVPLIYPNMFDTPKRAFGVIVVVLAIIYLISQAVLFFFLKQPENKIAQVKQEKTSLKEMIKVIKENDQLLVIIVSILLFNIGYFVTTSLGIYFFNYDFNKYGGSEFTIFSAILAVSQLTALILFPMLAKKFKRKSIFTFALGMIVLGYALFMSTGYVLPMNMLVIGLAGLFLFSGQGFIQVLVLVMLADTIEYGQWKRKKRNESIIFAINPFVTKLATSFQVLIVGITLSLSKLSDVTEVIANNQNTNTNYTTEMARADISNLVTTPMLLMLRLSMIVIPLILIGLSYLIYLKKYKIDEVMYEEITQALKKEIEEV